MPLCKLSRVTPPLSRCRSRCTFKVSCMGDAHQKPLVVLGSINADLVLKVDRLPKAGETLGASSLDFFPGGKGANQAAAAAKLGWATIMVGQLGTDSNAESLLQALKSAGVQTQHIQRIQGPSGTAVILLQSSGENSIIIVGGANQAWAELLPSSTQQLIAGAGALLLQREVPEVVNIQAAQAAAAAGVPVVLDVGGVEGPLSDQLLQHLTIISPNETELQRLTGLPTDTADEVVTAVSHLQLQAARLQQQQQHQQEQCSQKADTRHQPLQRGVQGSGPGHAERNGSGLRVLVKRGSAGSMMVDANGRQVLMQEAVAAEQVVDTTGAGDCFTAAFVVALLEGLSTAHAMHFAAAAASICVSRPGAMTSLPSRSDLGALLSKLPERL